MTRKRKPAPSVTIRWNEAAEGWWVTENHGEYRTYRGGDADPRISDTAAWAIASRWLAEAGVESPSQRTGTNELGEDTYTLA